MIYFYRMNIICTHCKVKFVALTRKAKFCTKACKQSDYRAKINTLVELARLSLKKVVKPIASPIVDTQRLKGESSIDYRIRISSV